MLHVFLSVFGPKMELCSLMRSTTVSFIREGRRKTPTKKKLVELRCVGHAPFLNSLSRLLQRSLCSKSSFTHITSLLLGT